VISANLTGIFFNGTSGDGPSNNLIQNNLVGTDVSGLLPLGNGGTGVYLLDSPSNTVGGAVPGAGNIIGANAEFGIVIIADDDPATADSNVVQGNLVGLDATGTGAMGNGLTALWVQDAAFTTVGGSEPDARNVFSASQAGIVLAVSSFDPSFSVFNEVRGNYVGTDVTGTVPFPNISIGVLVDAPDGIDVTPNGTSAVISGNLIGCDASGSFALPNGLGGLRLLGSSHVVGGATAGRRNVISGNSGPGVELFNSSGVVIQGNFIGTDVSGTAALPNAQAGVNFENAPDNLIGGTTPAERNVISGNPIGVRLGSLGDSTGNVLSGNFIGADVTGANAVPNLVGVLVRNSGNTIGGTVPGAGNLIMGNTDEGVAILSDSSLAEDNEILGNAIFGNGGLGIDLGSDGVTANDPQDGDGGANRLQNYPTLTRVDVGLSDTIIGGTIVSLPGGTFRVELFSGSACDGSGFGEGRTFLNFTMASTNILGIGSFEVTVPTEVALGAPVTATLTSASGNTSEFSACFAAEACTFSTFPHTVLAQDVDTLAWAAPEDARFINGILSLVSTYATTGSGNVSGTTLDISGAAPEPGSGLYYLLRLEDCGSWQTVLAAEPGRDAGLP
jgi:titin